MYALAQKQRDTYKALAVGVTLAYAVIACAIPLLHSDDCPAARGTAGTHFPSERPCPACKFLANANATEVQFDLTLVLTGSKTVTESASHSVAVIDSLCADSIVLRGPPLVPIS